MQAITIQYIRDRFSNLVIIMDEVHETGEEIHQKINSCTWLEMITRYAVNKDYPLTATPVYNIASEIVWIMNLLLHNDKKAPMQEHLIFKKMAMTTILLTMSLPKSIFIKKQMDIYHL